MNISRFFIDRPIFAGVLSLMVMIAGMLAMFQLPNIPRSRRLQWS